MCSCRHHGKTNVIVIPLAEERPGELGACLAALRSLKTARYFDGLDEDIQSQVTSPMTVLGELQIGVPPCYEQPSALMLKDTAPAFTRAGVP